MGHVDMAHTVQCRICCSTSGCDKATHMSVTEPGHWQLGANKNGVPPPSALSGGVPVPLHEALH